MKPIKQLKKMGLIPTDKQYKLQMKMFWYFIGVVFLALLIAGCTAWEEYDWESDFFKKRFATQEVPVEPKEKPDEICGDCICNMDLCT